jgi:hypothetical protein
VEKKQLLNILGLLSLALVIRDAMCMHRVTLRPSYFPSLFYKGQDFLKKMFENKTCGLLHLKGLSDAFPVLRMKLHLKYL